MSNGNNKQVEEFVKQLKERGDKHISYKYYSTKERIIGNLDSRSIYLSSGSNWNDVIDSGTFQSNADGIKRYGLCFSYGRSENVAMWIIYSKAESKNGMMMSLPNKLINEIINRVNKVELGEFVSGIFINRKVVKLKALYLVDMYYTSRALSDENKDAKYTLGDKHYDLDETVFQATKQYSKAFPWKYENECRLVAEVDKKSCGRNNILRIELTDEEIEKIYSSCLVDGPANEYTEYKESKLQGLLRL